ncbi:MAG: permease [Nitrospira bacterium SG8_3]|jgi:predicted PurR-regulated permease PerM|nr:MAG: permease [Nitrospira bacterium SG8_3]
MQRVNLNRSIVLLCALLVTAIFLSMIRQFLMPILLAGIFSSLAYPIYRRFERWFGGRRALASIVTLLLIVTGILLPLGALLGMVTAQAIEVGQSVTPWIKEHVSRPAAFSELLASVPFYDRIQPHEKVILEKAGEIVGTLSSFLISRLSSATVMTINFLFMMFILLYSMFFFLMDGHKLLDKILFYLPLEETDERRLLDKFTSVTRATLKGTIVIGILQGGLAGLAFAVVGIKGAVFWGTIMAVLSIIPGIGTALVWVPAAIVLAAGGHLIKAAGLAAFCAIVVGSVDNFLRPLLVGRDTQMHELLILLGTLGGILMFGVVGFIIGPIIAALFTAVWEIYGVVFGEVLPPVTAAGSTPSKEEISQRGAPLDADSKRQT